MEQHKQNSGLKSFLANPVARCPSLDVSGSGDQIFDSNINLAERVRLVQATSLDTATEAYKFGLVQEAVSLSNQASEINRDISKTVSAVRAQSAVTASKLSSLERQSWAHELDADLYEGSGLGLTKEAKERLSQVMAAPSVSRIASPSSVYRTTKNPEHGSSLGLEASLGVEASLGASAGVVFRRLQVLRAKLQECLTPLILAAKAERSDRDTFPLTALWKKELLLWPGPDASVERVESLRKSLLESPLERRADFADLCRKVVAAENDLKVRKKLGGHNLNESLLNRKLQIPRTSTTDWNSNLQAQLLWEPAEPEPKSWLHKTVELDGQPRRVGTVQYQGLTEFAPGEWLGVELQDWCTWAAKNDGCVDGVRYFEGRSAVFVRSDRVAEIQPGTDLQDLKPEVWVQEEDPTSSSILLETVIRGYCADADEKHLQHILHAVASSRIVTLPQIAKLATVADLGMLFPELSTKARRVLRRVAREIGASLAQEPEALSPSVRHWLQKIKMSRYEENFQRNKILTLEQVSRDVGDHRLQIAGIHSIKDRNAIMNEVVCLRQSDRVPPRFPTRSASVTEVPSRSELGISATRPLQISDLPFPRRPAPARPVNL